ELIVIQFLRQASEAGAVPDKIGPHRQYDCNWDLTLCRGLQKQFNKNTRFVLLRRFMTIAEQLLELIDDQQQIAAFWKMGIADQLQKPVWSAPEFSQCEFLTRQTSLLTQYVLLE